MRFEIAASSLDETSRIAQALAKIVCVGDVVLLCGPMGAGKTAFTKSFSSALGVEERVTSPTFVFIQSYEGDLTVHHADLYRIDTVNEVEDLGLIELVEEDGVAIVEWGEIAEPLLGGNFLRISIQPDEEDDDLRMFSFEPLGESWRERAIALEIAIQESLKG